MKPETIVLSNGKEVVLIHLERDGKIECMPHLQQKDMSSQKERAAPHMRTGELGGVTCPMCKRAMGLK